MAPESCCVIAVRAAEGHPLLLSTSRHVTQGIVNVTGDTWNAQSATLSAQSAIVANAPYELRIAGLADGGKNWKPVAVEPSEEYRKAGFTATMKPDGTLLRVTVQSPVTRIIKWSVKFATTL